MKFIPYVMGAIMLGACSSGPQEKITLPEIDISASNNGVVELPPTVPEMVRNTFVRYTKYMAPNGKPIHFLAQDAWTDDQILHAREVLQHILTDFPGSDYGHDKTAIANSMSDKKACMVLFNDIEAMDEAFNAGLWRLDLSMQDLRSNESPAVGDSDYLGHVTRDAAYEEVWHLVHDYGVVPTLPEMIAEMRTANDAAGEKGWQGWPEDEPENHPNEYVGVLIDNYYDLWAVQPKLYEAHPYEQRTDGGTHWGSYFANNRARVKEEDPLGFAVIEKFFPPYLTFTPQLPLDFSGTFSITLDETKAYTFKSQHLVNVILRGDNNANLVGNNYANELIGNSGNNTLKGSGDDDYIDGGGGDDTAVFTGTMDEYEVSNEGGITRVMDQIPNRDGSDRLENVEYLMFSDKKLKLNE